MGDQREKSKNSVRRHRIGTAFIVIGIVAIAAGAALGVYNVWDGNRAGRAAGAVLEEIDRYLEKTAAERGEISGEMIPDYVLDPTRDMPTVEIDGELYIGTVSIPVIDVELPVMADWDYARLRIAPCRYKGSAYLNDMILCAHNYETHFGRLKNLEPGDMVIFTDMDGNVFSYQVAVVDTLAGTAIQEMESGDWDLTLFTCTIGGRTRVTVRCDLYKE